MDVSAYRTRSAAPMADADRRGAELVEQVGERGRQRLKDEGEAFARFVTCYFVRAPWDDLATRPVADLYSAALSHYRLLQGQRRGEHAIRIFNPRADEEGWESPHTVVQVVVDDMPFLVDSVHMAVNRAGVGIHLSVHPTMGTIRDPAGAFAGLAPADGHTVSLIHLEVDRRTEADDLACLRGNVAAAVGDVQAAVADWEPMRARMRAIIDTLASPPAGLDPDAVAEDRAFLAWVESHHFTFTGYREYDLVQEDGEYQLRVVPGSRLGVARRYQETDLSATFAALPAEARAAYREPGLLVLTKANYRSRVHRPDYLDYIGIKRFDADGQIIGECRFLGLYTAAFYNENPAQIPLLRRKIRAVIERADLTPSGHDGRALLNILATYPRDELFQISTEELYASALRILRLRGRVRPGLFVRTEAFGRFVTCLAFIPRERFDTQVRRALQSRLQDVFGGESVDVRVQLTESPLAQVFFTIHLPPGLPPAYDLPALEDELVALIRSWQDDLRDALLEQYGEEEGSRLWVDYMEAFPVGYREDFVARVAARDVARIEAARQDQGPVIVLHRDLEDPADVLRLRLFAADTPVMLSDAIPILENLGVRVAWERPYRIEPSRGGRIVHLHDFVLRHQEPGLDVDAVSDLFEAALSAVWAARAESDGFNRLVLRARLAWGEVAVLRAYAKYLRQAGTAFSQAYMEEVLVDHTEIVRLLVGLFAARFDPARRDRAATRIARVTAHLQDALDRVERLDADRILRAFLTLIQATLRTNFYQRDADGERKDRIVFKLDPTQIPDLPEPRPAFELWVYSPRVEGVHLRAGRVARGGLRWSDRREDFRTEVLGLMKAQIVKNSIIVPVGAKGGFVVKRLPEGGREAQMEEVIACYRTFVRGLLDVTDNLVDGHPVPPAEVVRYDEDDPYLVVAADKGTAAFSDIANAIAAEYRFWLGDAFASGGSVGYDHKKMGITARGAWEAVRRHFRELGKDIDQTPISVVGIGDMSGDVFGNGMLLSRHLELVAAFDHRHIFIDPDPDPERSFVERERLFHLPRSSWADYDRAVLSPGGGVWPRTVKAIPVSEGARHALGIDASALTPPELIRAILRAPVDLLWNGGIGTYVKASSETHADVGDRANDANRVDGAELRCAVVGEGGNLGFTQLGRVEYALHGGRINTDFIDNAGGVNASDHEVNIKILLDAVVGAGDLTVKQRNEQLLALTDEVAQLVIDENYWQSWSLSLIERQSWERLDQFVWLIRHLEAAWGLDRVRAGLPDEAQLKARRAAGKGLTRPELAVLAARARILIFRGLIDSDAPEDPILTRELVRYFPKPLRARYREAIEQHRLRRELIATFVTNRLVNRLGPVFVFELREQQGIPIPMSTRTYLAAWEVFGLRQLWTDTAALDNRVPAGTQTAMLAAGENLIRRAAMWLLRHRPGDLAIEPVAREFAPTVELLIDHLPSVITARQAERLDARAEPFVTAGVPPELARLVAGLDALYSALDIATIARETGATEVAVAEIYFALDERLELEWLRDRIHDLKTDGRWQELARAAMAQDLDDWRRRLTAEVVSQGPPETIGPPLIDTWLGRQRHAVERLGRLMAEARGDETVGPSMLSVLVGQLRRLAS